MNREQILKEQLKIEGLLPRILDFNKNMADLKSAFYEYVNQYGDSEGRRESVQYQLSILKSNIKQMAIAFDEPRIAVLIENDLMHREDILRCNANPAPVDANLKRMFPKQGQGGCGNLQEPKDYEVSDFTQMGSDCDKRIHALNMFETVAGIPLTKKPEKQPPPNDQWCVGCTSENCSGCGK